MNPSSSSAGSSPIEEISTKLPSSSYTGVVPQHNGRWRAQIYEHHRCIWLGTFADETEAARAYDIAAQRFRGREATTNFPPLTETDPERASELVFLSAHSKTEIVDMLRKDTYHEELRHRRRNQQLGRNVGGRRTGTWSERELLFYKVVTPSDVGKLNRLVIPKQHAEKHFPLRNEEKGEESNNGVLLNFEDADGKVWRFRYSYWNSSQSYVLTKGWGQFVKEKGLNAGDVVSFWRYFDGCDMMQLLIDCEVVQPGEQSAALSSSNVRMNESEDTDDQDVQLFGVNMDNVSSFGGGFGGSDVRPGDWYCNCGAHNFASRSSCFKCSAFKEESAVKGGFDGDMPRSRGFGFGNVGSDRPGRKSGDWICTRSGCNEHNFGSRMKCFRCNAPRESGELRQNQMQIFLPRTSGETTTTESNPNISTDLSEKDSFNESPTISSSKSSIFSDTSEKTIEQKYLTTEIQTRSTEKLEANRSKKTEILSNENINLNSNSNLTENSSKEENVESITNKKEPDTEPFGGSFHEIPLIGRQSISSLKRIEIEDCELLHALPDGLIPYGPCYARCDAHDLSNLPYSTGHTMHEANTFGRDADFLPSEKEKSISVVSINDEGGLTDHMVDKATIFGRSAETMEVSNFLLSERKNSFSVISIVGKGGLGKTTIAQLVYKDLRASRCFDLFGWICVSEGFDVRRLIKVTIESISKINYGVSDLNLLQVELAEIVKEKTILLVLDDVCNENQSLWELFQEPFIEAKMVRILVTTRNEKVAEVMQTTTCYRPINLPEYSCWQLFQHHALSSTSETLPTPLVDMGREIMRKCDGLPLAVKIIASLLRHETDEKIWREILESDLWESNPTNNILPALQISYDHLPAHLKLCFLVCSMYPKDYLLEKMNLIDIWISHGYIESRDKRRTTEIGVEYYEELKERSFIDGFSNCIQEWWHMQPMYALDGSSGQFFEFCKLHDIIHDLARYNSKKEHYSMEINQPLDIQKENFPLEVHHLYAGGFVGYVKQILQRNDKNLKDLRTLSLDVRGCSGDLEHQYCINNTEAVDLNSELSKDYEECSGEVAISNLIKFEGLTVLELKGHNLRKIPDCISKLKHLAYLSITSSYLKVLPLSIGLLYNLQTLFLDCFLLEYLPENIGNLANLQFLYIQSGRVKKLPKSLCSLNNLLRLVIRSDDLEEVPLNIKNLCNLHTLTIRSNQIQVLPNTIGCLTNLEELNLLSLGGSYDDLPVGKLDYVPQGFVNFPAIKTMAAWMGVRTINWLKDMKDLEGKLSIGGLKHMSNLENAQHANLRNKCKLETLDLCWDPGYYISPYNAKSELRLSLIPEACKGELVCADDVVSFSLLECLQPHPNLKKLLIRWYPSPTVPYWMTDPSSFQSIQQVLLECCVNIQSLPFKNFHTLKHLTIVACSSIRVLQLEQVSYQLERLQIVSCDNLELIAGLGDLNMLAALEIYSCQALKSLTMGGKQLVLSTETFEDSSHEKPHTSKQSIVSLGRLEIENCYLLHFLPDGLIPPGPCYVCVRGCGCPDMERNLISAANEISCTSNLWRWR